MYFKTEPDKEQAHQNLIPYLASIKKLTSEFSSVPEDPYMFKIAPNSVPALSMLHPSLGEHQRRLETVIFQILGSDHIAQR